MVKFREYVLSPNKSISRLHRHDFMPVFFYNYFSMGFIVDCWCRILYNIVDGSLLTSFQKGSSKKKMEKRKDKKGIVLRAGEYQRPNNKYEYKYTDNDGHRRSVTADTLKQLRQMEDAISRDKLDGIPATVSNSIIPSSLSKILNSSKVPSSERISKLFNGISVCN